MMGSTHTNKEEHALTLELPSPKWRHVEKAYDADRGVERWYNLTSHIELVDIQESMDFYLTCN